jgi:TolA-binding protein
MGRHDRAAALFGSVLAGRIMSPSPAQSSFAALGLARAMIATNDLSHAKEAYLLSLKASEKAAWQDETLREAALLIERQSVALVVPPSGGGPKGLAGGGIPPQGGTTNAGTTNAAAEVLPYWVNLATNYSSSPYAAEALYHAARLQMESGKWKLAAENLERLVKDFPTNPWAGDAHVILIDTKLELLLDLEGAQKDADAAVRWYEHAAQKVAPELRLPTSDLRGADDPFSPFPVTLARPLGEVAYDIYLRAGLLEYLHEQYGAAVIFFEKAKPFTPPLKIQVIGKAPPSGVERLIVAAKTGKTLTPDIVRKGDPTAKAALMLGDVYHEGQQYEKSLDLCNRLLSGPGINRATPEQKSYAHFRRARNYFLSLGRTYSPDASLADNVAAVAAAPKTPWAEEAMFLAGNIEWNQKHDLQAAVAVWHRLVHDYPGSKEADRCELYIGAAYFSSKQYVQAQQALESFLTLYPESEFVASGKRLLDECKAKADGSPNRAGRSGMTK